MYHETCQKFIRRNVITVIAAIDKFYNKSKPKIETDPKVWFEKETITFITITVDNYIQK